MSKTFAITPTLDLLLRGSADMPVGLYHLHVATAEQLTRLHYKAGTLKTVGKRLKLLVDNGYIQADCVPTKNFKSPFYYSLDTKGIRYLLNVGVDVPESMRASKESMESYLHLRHALELNDVFIAANLMRRASTQSYLYEWRHERELRREPYLMTHNGRRISLIPDGFVDIRIRKPNEPERRLALIIEHDRGTEQKEHFKRRIQAYKGFYATDGPMKLFQVKTAVVAFTNFSDHKRVLEMREWTCQELQDSPQLQSLFVFAELPKPLETKHLLFERRWYTLTDGQPIALLEG